jgi:hypothetical protein
MALLIHFQIVTCNLHRNASFLSIYNSNLSSLTIGSTIQEVGYKIMISTPNLNSITLLRDLIHQVSVCDLYFLEQVNFNGLEITYSGLYNQLAADAS